jgi:hypothetical protein
MTHTLTALQNVMTVSHGMTPLPGFASCAATRRIKARATSQEARPCSRYCVWSACFYAEKLTVPWPVTYPNDARGLASPCLHWPFFGPLL